MHQTAYREVEYRRDCMSRMSALVAAFSLVYQQALAAPTQREIVAEHIGKRLNPSEIAISLERTPCFGSCPAYRVTIKGSGEVEYEGIRAVKVRGIRKVQLEEQAVLMIANELLRVHFFDAANEYVTRDEVFSDRGTLTIGSALTSDGSSTFVGMRIGKYDKRVQLYDNYPQELGAITNMIDEAVGIERFIGSDCELMSESPRLVQCEP